MLMTHENIHSYVCSGQPVFELDYLKAAETFDPRTGFGSTTR